MTFELGGFDIKIDKQAVLKIAGDENIGKALLILGQVGEEAAKSHAPVDTGHLRRSITHQLVDGGTENQHALVGTNVSYAIFQEFGTRFHVAHPFMRPAIGEIEQFLKNI